MAHTRRLALFEKPLSCCSGSRGRQTAVAAADPRSDERSYDSDSSIDPFPSAIRSQLTDAMAPAWPETHPVGLVIVAELLACGIPFAMNDCSSEPQQPSNPFHPSPMNPSVIRSLGTARPSPSALPGTTQGTPMAAPAAAQR